MNNIIGRADIKIASLFESIRISGGVEKIQSNLSIGLTDLGYNFVHLLLDDRQTRNAYKGEILNLNEKFIVGFGVRKILLLFKVAWKVKEICKREKIDVLIGQGDFFFMITGLSKLLGCKSKCIAIVHTSIGVRNFFVTGVMRYFIAKHDHVVMTSQQELETFINRYHFDKNKLTLIYNSIDIEKTLMQSKNLVPEERSFLFKNNKKTFVNIARLNYQKNQQLLIRAFSLLENRNNLQLILIGEGDERKNLEQLIEELNLKENVFLVGNQSNPHAFISKSDYRVLSSRFEGFPVVFSEGGLFKKPMIAVDCPTGPREFFDPERIISNINGYAITNHGILVQFDEKEPKYLSGAMEYVQKNSLSYQEEKIFNYVQQFDISKNAKQWDVLIQSLVD